MNPNRDVEGHRTVAHTADVRIEAWAPTFEGCLAAVLDEVIYVLDTRGRVPCRADLTPGPTGTEMRLHLAPVGAAELVGAVPKAVTLHDLRFERSADGWWCGVTVDV